MDSFELKLDYIKYYYSRNARGKEEIICDGSKAV